MTTPIEDKKCCDSPCHHCPYFNNDCQVCHTPQKDIEGWEEDIKKVARPSATTHSGLEVVYDPNALISQIHQLLTQERERVERVIDGMIKDADGDGNIQWELGYEAALTDLKAKLKNE